jgi:hypothetical protein
MDAISSKNVRAHSSVGGFDKGVTRDQTETSKHNHLNDHYRVFGVDLSHVRANPTKSQVFIVSTLSLSLSLPLGGENEFFTQIFPNGPNSYSRHGCSVLFCFVVLQLQ